jgi:ribosomal protein S18 acetylase RimI-like enzyme
MVPEALVAHRALVAAWARLYAEIEGARFETRSDLIVAICPDIPVPPFNGPWVVEDSSAAVAALPAAIAEVEEAGAQPFLQSRTGHERTRAAARELGLTHVDRLPALVARPDELSDAAAALEIARMAPHELEAAVDLQAAAFDEPREIFARFGTAALRMPGARWYVGRAGADIVATALGLTADGATGIFNVATKPEWRRRGYGSALTARAARDGFADGAELAYLHSSPDGHAVYRRLGFREVDEYVVLSRPQLG